MIDQVGKSDISESLKDLLASCFRFIWRSRPHRLEVNYGYGELLRLNGHGREYLP